jgi:hypothetical protein
VFTGQQQGNGESDQQVGEHVRRHPIHRLPEGLDRSTAGRPPIGGDRVQLQDEGGSLPGELGAQVGPEENVDAVVRPPRATGDQRRVAFEGVQHLRSVRPTGQPDGELRRDRVADADQAQQVPGAGGHALEDLTNEIVRDRPLVSGELDEEALGVFGGAEGGRREPQARGPPVRPLVQHRRLLRGQGRYGTGEQLRCFRSGEPQLLGAQLAEPALKTLSHQGQRWVEAGGERESDGGGKVAYELLHRAQRLLADDLLQIVEDQPNRHRELVEGVDQVGQELVPGIALRYPEPVHDAVGGHGGAAGEGGDDGRAQPLGIVVVAVEVHPSRGVVGRPAGPVCEQKRLAVPGRRADQHHCLRSGLQSRDQPGPGDELRWQLGDRGLHARDPHAGGHLRSRLDEAPRLYPPTAAIRGLARVVWLRTTKRSPPVRVTPLPFPAGLPFQVVGG